MIFKKICTILEKIKATRPLVLNLTNHVSIEFVANGLLSLGASPVMSFCEDEIEDLLKISKALVINTGTLNKEFVELCHKACDLAQQLNTPIIYDPVGAGASLYRTQVGKEILEKYSVSILRGNASEISSLSGEINNTKGVDSTKESIHSVEAAKFISLQSKTTVCMSGKVDIVVHDNKVSHFERGSSIMTEITGTGCLLTAIVGAFHCVEQNSFEAASLAAVFYGVCGEIAAKKSNGPGAFHTNFLDALSLLPVRGDYE